MRHIVARHMEGGEHLEHIAKLYWYESEGPHKPDTGELMVSTREQMYIFVKGGGHGFAVSRNDGTSAYLEPVQGQYVNYVKTKPDSTKADNLLSLPKY